MSKRPIRMSVIALLGIAALHSRSLPRSSGWNHAGETTQMARKLLLERIAQISRNIHCRQSFGRQRIDLDVLRLTAGEADFYDATGPEGDLSFSAVVGKPASPDQTLRRLAAAVSADAFVLGYYTAEKYVRTKHVVLTRGFLQQQDAGGEGWRATTRQEKQNLLLHEILHVALSVDDDNLNSRDLCPLRLLAFCRSDEEACN